MAASDEFKQALKDERLQDALEIAIAEAIELEITTWVCVANPYNTHPDTPTPQLPGHRMRTRINLVEGDIETEIGGQFVGNGAYTDLRDFHIRQIEDSRDVVNENLDNLEQMVAMLARTLQQLSNLQNQKVAVNQSPNLLESSEIDPGLQ